MHTLTWVGRSPVKAVGKAVMVHTTSDSPSKKLFDLAFAALNYSP
jgi:hypothetical protein